MLQSALVDKSKQEPRSQVSVSRTIVAPIKGWYVGAPLAQAPDQTAVLIENAFPEIDFVRARGGSLPYAFGMTFAAVDTLMPYRAGGAYRMFASCNGRIYDVSNPGLVGAALVTGLSAGARFSYIQFSATGQQTLLAANGVDPVQLYNGTTWGVTPAITGLTGAPLNYLWVYESNIWGLQPGSLDAWYLPGSAIGGPISIYPMAPLFKRGGQLIAGGTWSIQTTGGLEFANVFVTDQGEVAIFAGSTPALTWALQGVYQISPPLGSRCLLQAGGDLAIMTTDGITAISQVQTTDQIALQNTSVTIAIQPAWQQAVQDRQGLVGWQILEWPLKTMVIVNMPQTTSSATPAGGGNILTDTQGVPLTDTQGVPLTDVQQNRSSSGGPGGGTQFIGNGRTGAWCRYVGWDAQCFEIGGAKLDQLLYGTSDGRVMQGETGGQDDGKTYTMTIFPSFTDMAKTDYGFPSLNQSATRKQTKMIRPRLQTFGNIAPQVTMRTDFDETIPSPPPAPAVSLLTGAKWGIALWGIDVWPRSTQFVQSWLPAFAIGTTLSPVVQVTFDQVQMPVVQLTSIDVLFEAGSLFG